VLRGDGRLWGKGAVTWAITTPFFILNEKERKKQCTKTK